ncbi:hypothetical protein VKT23_007780 [Stygiomarasmius scandens]|uniref:Uncharacterized protein n=1 Tax=Marasmiellus scandens TaxID=2682957 RepID=A0ABR1JJA4_9AGAR
MSSESDLQHSTLTPMQTARLGANALLARLPRLTLDRKQTAKLTAGTLMTVGSTMTLPSIGLAAVNAAGFTSAGVAPGSVATIVQPVVYGAYTTGTFSALQSVGATAVMASPAVLGIGATLVVIGGVTYIVTKVKEGEDKPLEKSD